MKLQVIYRTSKLMNKDNGRQYDVCDNKTSTKNFYRQQKKWYACFSICFRRDTKKMFIVFILHTRHTRMEVVLKINISTKNRKHYEFIYINTYNMYGLYVRNYQHHFTKTMTMMINMLWAEQNNSNVHKKVI